MPRSQASTHCDAGLVEFCAKLVCRTRRNYWMLRTGWNGRATDRTNTARTDITPASRAHSQGSPPLTDDHAGAEVTSLDHSSQVICITVASGLMWWLAQVQCAGRRLEAINEG